MRHNAFAETTTAPVAVQAPASPSPNAAAPNARPKGLKKVTFGKIAEKKEDTSTAYPVFTDTNGEVALIAARIKRRTDELEALEGALSTDKAELKMRVAPFWFQVNAGKHEVPSSISVQSEAGEVLVTFQNRYPKLADEAPIVAILGEDRAPEYFRQAFTVSISGDAIPENPEGTAAQEFMDELQQLAAKFNAVAALEVKDSIKPVATFHAARHRELTLAENLALEQAFPIVAMVKTKGRGK